VADSLLARPRRALANAVRHRVAGSEFEAAHARIWHTAGEREFTEDDAIWRVHADTAMFIGGIRALLLQALHPDAMLGVSEHSGFRGDPWGRLQRTSTYLATTTFGTVADTERAIAIVRAIHGRVQGTTPDGRTYRADDRHLLMWIHIAEIDSFLATHRAFGADPLSDADADSYVRQTGEVVARLGVVNPPTTVAELREILQSYRPELRGSEPAREATELLLADPPLTGLSRLGYRVLAAGAISTLPAWTRVELRLPSLPITDRTVVRPLARSAMATMRWALSGI
jgi:uncharacterized protein (DUF2236 family)